MLRVAVEHRGDEPVLVRRADGPDEAALRDEATLLADLAGLAVPRVLTVDHDQGTTTLTTTYRPAIHRLTVTALAQAAATLARAHERGRAHGAFDQACITVSPGAGVLVDGWRGTGTPADDVAALGRLIDQVALATPSARAAAARATSTDPSTRPQMSTLADALAESSAGSPTPTRPWTPARPTHRVQSRKIVPRPSRMLLVAGGCLVASIATLAVLALGRIGSAPAPLPSDAPASTAIRPFPGTADSHLVTIGGQRWMVGSPGDIAILGDWDCDGSDEPALLRLDGSVWQWAQVGATPAHVGTAPSGRSLAVASDSRGCDRLEVRRSGGQSVAIRPGPGPA